MNNVNAKLLLELSEEGAIGWKVIDLLRGNEHLITAYHKVESGEDSQQELLNTTLITKDGGRKKSLAINFRVYSLETSKGRSGDILVLMQPIPKVL